MYFRLMVPFGRAYVSTYIKRDVRYAYRWWVGWPATFESWEVVTDDE